MTNRTPTPRIITNRSVAQPGSAPQWGCGGREFESPRSDHIMNNKTYKFLTTDIRVRYNIRMHRRGQNQHPHRGIKYETSATGARAKPFSPLSPHLGDFQIASYHLSLSFCPSSHDLNFDFKNTYTQQVHQQQPADNLAVQPMA